MQEQKPFYSVYPEVKFRVYPSKNVHSPTGIDYNLRFRDMVLYKWQEKPTPEQVKEIITIVERSWQVMHRYLVIQFDCGESNLSAAKFTIED